MADPRPSREPTSQDDECVSFPPRVDTVPPAGHPLADPLHEPWKYIRAIPGKNVRGQLIDAFQFWLEIPPETVSRIKTIVGILHDASLLVDDIEDDSDMRRGVPVAHAVYGLPLTLNCANYMYFVALQECRALDNAQAMGVYVDEMLNLHRGQGHDILWREQGMCPTLDEYKAMVCDKTGGLFRLSVGLMQAFSPRCTTDFVPLLNHMAIYFQIRDDYMNLVSEKYMEHKSFCEDLTEGKFSFPLIHAIRSAPDDHRLVHILKQRTKKIDLKKHALEYLAQVGSLDYTRKVLNHAYLDIQTVIQDLGGNPRLSAILQKLHQTIDDDHGTPPIPRVISTKQYL